MDHLVPHKRFLLFATGLMAVGAVLVSLQLLAGASTARADHDPVPICHVDGNGVGHTITVDDSALAGHFNENGTPREGHLEDSRGPCQEDLVATSTATAIGQTVATSTPTTVANTATATTEAATSTATSVPATATSGPLTVVTNTPTGQAIISSESLGGTQGGANGVQGGGNGGIASQQGVASGVQGGASAEQGVTSGTQGGGNGTVAGVARLPSTGSGGAGSGAYGMLYFGIALMVLGAGLCGTKILIARR